MEFYVAENGQPTGPFNLQQLAQKGITPDTLVWKEGMAGWEQAGNIPELSAYLLGGAQATDTLPNGGFEQPAMQQPPYNPQTPYGQQPQMPYTNTYGNIPPCPKTWLVESILVTLFCCLPFGIIGIIKAANVSSNYNSGNYIQAEKDSKDAGKWTKLGFFISLIGGLIYLLFIFVLTALGVGAASL